jgi:hypothetical protein
MFRAFSAHHQELNDCSSSLWFYLRIVVIVVLCSWSGRPAGPTNHKPNKSPINQVGDLFELNVKFRCQKVKILNYVTVLHVMASQASFTQFCMIQKQWKKGHCISKQTVSSEECIIFFFNLR